MRGSRHTLHFCGVCRRRVDTQLTAGPYLKSLYYFDHLSDVLHSKHNTQEELCRCMLACSKSDVIRAVHVAGDIFSVV